MPSETAEANSALTRGSRLRVGVLYGSLGRIRYGAALAAAPVLEVTGVSDLDPRAAKTWARALGGKAAVFADLPALLASDPPLEALLLAAPLAERAALLTLALHAPLPVLCDAPFAFTLAETDRLLDLAVAHQALLMPVFPRRFDPYFQELARQAEAGAVGEIRQARCEWSFPVGGAANLSNGGDPAEGWNVMFSHIACQTADLCRLWLGDAQGVSADIFVPERGARTSSGQYPHGGALANLIVTHERGQATHHLYQSRSQQPGERYLLTGAQGQLELIVSAGERSSVKEVPDLRLLRPGQRPERLPVPLPDASLPPETQRLQRLLTHFAEAARTPELAAPTGTDARAALEIVHAAYLSAREGQKIRLPLRHSPPAPV